MPRHLSKTLIWTTIVACLASIQYGYHMAELNSPGSSLSCLADTPVPGRTYLNTWMYKLGLKQCISMDEQGLGMVTSVFSVGGLISSLYAGWLADKIGRKWTTALNSVIFFAGSLIVTFANNYSVFILGRFIGGMAAGCGIVVTPLLINEISPHHLKGSLGSMNQVAINLGILLTQVLAIQLANSIDWRYLMLVGAVLALFNFVAVLTIDESPKWLSDKGYTAKAKQVQDKLRCEQLSQSLLSTVEEGAEDVGDDDESTPTTTVTLNTYMYDPIYRNSLIVVTAILAGQQFCGINSVVFYGVNTIRKLTSPQNAVIINCFISLGNALITFFSAPYIDKNGRKPCMLLSVGIMGVASTLIAVGNIYGIALVTVIFTFLYVAAFAIGLGPIPFLMISELTQPEAKGAAQSYGTSVNWIATFMVGYFFPILDASIGGYLYFIFAGVCLGFVYYLDRKVPETKGHKTYEEVWSLRLD
ncbi:hypothetical protein WICPIJ_002366 [Wickerhamomyces pijperi]|uniref:Major facilitator superfamily (MFS) profile domain-containing protein n=1 Tax=Wickerhamomyces pijperi TaxID=599730 RepID=A0A9P8TP11_WICPI|nr:hypothetical protein WICPIJ_002366 [Wickerhamomyces pijperi]